MRVSEILWSLPATLDWMVLFDLATFRALTEDATIRRMYGLPKDAQLGPYSHVVLTSDGVMLAPRTGSSLVDSDGSPVRPAGSSGSLYDRFANELALVPVEQGDCLGLGQSNSSSPVALSVTVESGYGAATAVFEWEPSREHYELLAAVGVEYLGGYQDGAHFIARFRNRLADHIGAGLLAQFTRTGHCTQFFLQHGVIDPPLESGLNKALNARVAHARNLTLDAARTIARRACAETLALTCRPPAPARPYPYGDIVPLGLLLRALRALPAGPALFEQMGLCQQVRDLLLVRRQGRLWSYHSGGLVTATDSALVLLGLRDAEAVEALEIFADGEGGYYPQRWSESGEPGTMRVEKGTRHWCRPDYATTCLVAALRREAGLPAKTSSAYLAAGFETRSGLYFANPYMVDWALALALGEDETAAQLRRQLAAEIFAGMNDDYSFGSYDVPLSTAFAILALAALGHHDRTVRLAQLRLLEFMQPDGGWPEAIPFYSTLAIDDEQVTPNALVRRLFADTNRQIARANGQYHAISLYLDGDRMISTAIAALALPEVARAEDYDRDPRAVVRVVPHARYRCRDHREYIATVALPPYITPRDTRQDAL